MKLGTIDNFFKKNFGNSKIIFIFATDFVLSGAISSPPM